MALLDDNDLRATAAALAQAGTVRGAARILGITAKAVRKRRVRMAERGMLGYAPVLPGFVVKAVASKSPTGEWVRQAREPGPAFTTPVGHIVRGESALVDGEGRTLIRWIKTQAEAERATNLRDAIVAAFAGYAGPATLPPAPAYTSPELLTIYPIADLHLGLYAWAKETGADYDLKIGARLLRDSVANLVTRSANSEHAIVLDLGDYFHADNSQNRTARSGNTLDVDTRYSRVLRVGYELVVECIELALQKHARVTYRKLPGNHDDETSLMLAISIAAHFRNEPRVTVDTDPSRFYVHRFGACMVAATHGDQLKMADLAGYAAAQWPREWGATTYRYAYTGHVHNERAANVSTLRGMRAESFNTLAGKDAWHAGMGYQSQRTAHSITLHRDMGEIDRLTVNLPGAPRAANDNTTAEEKAA